MTASPVRTTQSYRFSLHALRADVIISDRVPPSFLLCSKLLHIPFMCAPSLERAEGKYSKVWSLCCFICSRIIIGTCKCGIRDHSAASEGCGVIVLEVLDAGSLCCKCSTRNATVAFLDAGFGVIVLQVRDAGS